MTLEEVKGILSDHRTFLNTTFGVKSLSLFGSYARNEQSPESDIDILVEFDGAIDLFEFIKLENTLGELLGRKADLVMKDALKPRIRVRVLLEAVEI